MLLHILGFVVVCCRRRLGSADELDPHRLLVSLRVLSGRLDALGAAGRAERVGEGLKGGLTFVGLEVGQELGPFDLNFVTSSYGRHSCCLCVGGLSGHKENSTVARCDGLAVFVG